MVEDITLRKKAEAELEKSFSLIKATLESTADGILVVDGKGKDSPAQSEVHGDVEDAGDRLWKRKMTAKP